MRNFFFFFDGDFPGDSSLPASAAVPSSAVGVAGSSVGWDWGSLFSTAGGSVWFLGTS